MSIITRRGVSRSDGRRFGAGSSAVTSTARIDRVLEFISLLVLECRFEQWMCQMDEPQARIARNPQRRG